MQDRLISIIVPVYKVEPWLRRCVDSILRQTYSNFELILVDDGSPDHCGAICDLYAEKDNRVVVIHQENQGVSSARNAALNLATGEYIGFVDSDDFIAPNMYELLVEGIEHYQAEIAFCGVCFVTDQGEINTTSKKKVTEELLRVIDQRAFVLGALEHQAWVNHTIWNKLYRRDILGKLRFDESFRICEDALFLLEYSRFIVKAAQIDASYYYYFCRQGSATRTDRFNSVLVLPAHEKMISIGAEIDKYAYYAAQASYLDCCLQYRDYPEARKSMHKYTIKHMNTLLRNPYIYWKTKILYILDAAGMNTGKRIRIKR